jgi:hypothetical protein
MAKKRTGLQSQIASIFSGVPIPKKGSGSEPSSSQPLPAAPERRQPKTPPAPGSAVPKYQPPVEPVREIPPARVATPKVPEPRIRQVPKVPPRKKERLTARRTGVNPARQKIAVAMVVILSILLVFLLTRPAQKHHSRPTASQAARQAKAAVLPTANIKIDWPVPRKYPEYLRDPMILSAPKQVKAQAPAALVVKGITYSEDRRFAVIGTQTVQEGDTIEGATVTKINRNSVEFERDGKRWTQGVQGGGK